MMMNLLELRLFPKFPEGGPLGLGSRGRRSQIGNALYVVL